MELCTGLPASFRSLASSLFCCSFIFAQASENGVSVVTRPADTDWDNSVNGDSVLTRPADTDRDNTVNCDSVLTRPEVTDRDQTTLNGDCSDKTYSQRRHWTL